MERPWKLGCWYMQLIDPPLALQEHGADTWLDSTTTFSQVSDFTEDWWFVGVELPPPMVKAKHPTISFQ